MISMAMALLSTIAISTATNSSPDDVVLNSSYTVTTQNSVGTGFNVNSDIVITAAHVVEGSTVVKLTATLPDTEVVVADVYYVDTENDIALLKPRTPLSAEPLQFAAENPETGDVVYTVGNALSGPTLSRGTIRTPLNEFGDIESNITVDHGYSGGALVNSSGEVLGVILTMSTQEANLAYAKPNKTIQQVIAQAKNKEGNTTPEAASSQKTIESNGLKPEYVVAVFAAIMLLVFVYLQHQRKQRRLVSNVDKIIITME